MTSCATIPPVIELTLCNSPPAARAISERCGEIRGWLRRELRSSGPEDAGASACDFGGGLESSVLETCSASQSGSRESASSSHFWSILRIREDGFPIVPSLLGLDRRD